MKYQYIAILYVLAIFSSPTDTMATPANDAAGKAVGEHYVAVKVAGQDKDIALAKCQKDTSASKRKVCRAEAAKTYKTAIAVADMQKKKALAAAELLNVKEESKKTSPPTNVIVK